MQSLLQDLRYGVRMLIKNPGLTIVAVLSLALGIGANTTIFSFVNALLFRPPAQVEEPDRLLEIWNKRIGASSADSFALSYPEYIHYRDHNHVFSNVAAFDGDPAFVSWSGGGQAEMVLGQYVTGNFFSVLGAKPVLGRTFSPEEDKTPGTHPVVVISERFWREHLGADPNVLGKTLTLNGNSLAVIGVTPAGFTGLLVGIAPDFWAPMMMVAQMNHDPEALVRRGGYWLIGVGRLKPGIASSQAQADLLVLSHQLQRAYPKFNKETESALFPATLLPAPVRGYVVAFTGLLMAVVALVLLIACANATNLLLAHALQRRREMAIRSSLGAKRARLIRQTLTESGLLSCLAGGIGVVLALWMIPLILKLMPPNLPIRLDIPLDARVLGFTLLLSLLTGVILGLVPALQGSKLDLVARLKDGTQAGGYSRSRLRSSLVVAQLAICVLLLISAGLCLRSLFNARSIDAGFEIPNRLAVTLDLSSLGYAESKGKIFFRTLVEQTETLPGVQTASLASYLPLETTRHGIGVEIEGYAPPAGQDAIQLQVTDIGPHYFRTMGTPLLRGREFTRHDDESAPRVAIINEAMAKRYWPGRDPLGRRLSIENERYEIVGVVKTGKYRTLGENPHPYLYRSFLQHYHPKATLVAHTAGEPRGLLPSIRREVQALDPNLALVRLGTLQEHMALALFPAYATGTLLSVFGLVALILDVVGIAGVIAYAVTQRTHEIGIRMALGAQQNEVLRMVVKQGAFLTLMGIVIGLTVSFALTRALSSLLYGIGSTDPLTFTAVSALLSAVALLASYIPARRSTRVDPVIALRYE